MAEKIYVIPYSAPWYELLLSDKLTLKTATGKFGVKTGSMPKKHRGWVGFYNSKGRIRREVVKRHELNPEDLNLGMLVGVGYLDDSRELTDEERYQWCLKSNKITDSQVIREAGDLLENSKSAGEKADWCNGELFQFAGSPLIIATPMLCGHFYRFNSIKRFLKPVCLKYPSGPVCGAYVSVTPEIRKALREIKVEL